MDNKLSKNKDKSKDRRLHQRFLAHNGAVALMRSDPNYLMNIDNMSMGEIGVAIIKSKPAKLGQIIDMSINGLSFWYVERPNQNDTPAKMDIVHAQEGFCIKDLNFETISDYELDDLPPYEPIKTRKARIQFTELTSHQRTLLDEFIRKHTKKEV